LFGKKTKLVRGRFAKNYLPFFDATTSKNGFFMLFFYPQNSQKVRSYAILSRVGI
jgi:hypothetical protein